MDKVLGNIRGFLTGTMAELRKCSWPARKELLESTLLVIVAIVILASFVFAVDFICRQVINLITQIS